MSTMRIIIVIILIIIALYLIQKSLPPPPTHTPPSPTAVTNTTSNVGQENATSQCKANHIDANDPQAYLPDHNCTPGVTNPAVTQDTISSTICVPGFTKTIRPKASYTNKLKREQIQAYGYIDTRSHDYEEDHFISLELGGSPTDPKNLWPEPHSSTNEKDLVEDYLHRQVCDGSITLAEAQKEITQNWYAVYQQIR